MKLLKRITRMRLISKFLVIAWFIGITLTPVRLGNEIPQLGVWPIVCSYIVATLVYLFPVFLIERRNSRDTNTQHHIPQNSSMRKINESGYHKSYSREYRQLSPDTVERIMNTLKIGCTAYIIRDNGEVVEGVAPVIISASRSTDIPAFFARWFINRLAKGYCVWYNPFNQQPMYISFKNTKAVVFWTKNPEPIIQYLPELDAKGIHYYFQYTLNDYEVEGFEPNVRPLEERIETFKNLSKF